MKGERRRRCYGGVPPRSARFWPLLLVLALAVKGDPAPAGDSVVILPPLFVTARRAERPPWRYACAGGVEVLSCCDDRTTRAFVAAYLRRKFQLDDVLPPRLRAEQTAPTALILIPPAAARAMNAELAAAMRENTGGRTSGYVTPAGAPIDIYRIVRMMPQIMLSDSDSAGAVFDLGERDLGEPAPDPLARRFFPGGPSADFSGLNFTSGRVAEMVGDRAPPLPEWFRSGFMAFYGTIDWNASARDYHDILSLSAPGPFAPPLIWISERESRALRRAPSADHPFLGAEELFAPPGAEEAPPARRAVRDAEIALLFHWALLDPARSRREELWRFADRASREPVTGALIRECFGLDPVALTQALRAFLPEALKRPVRLGDAGAAAAAPAIALRDASKLEIVRIQGDMGRREAAYVRADYPEEGAAYAEQAEAGLRRLYRQGERDPALLASYGLFEHFQDRDEAARPLLEAAAAARVPRPALYAVLARLRFQAALQHPGGPDGLLSPAQARSVLEMVDASRRYAPPQKEAYIAAIDAWAHSGPGLGPDAFALLEEAARDFPEDLDLVEGAAKLCAEHGQLPRAQRLIDWAISCQPAGSFHRERLGNFREELAKP